VDVGRGTQPEGKVTGAVTRVEDEKLGKSSPYRIEELLKGKLSGVQVITKPNGDYAFRVRGGNLSLNGEESQEALVLVDGIPTTASTIRAALSGLTPEDIRQVTVLKDVASTSMYGIRQHEAAVTTTTRWAWPSGRRLACRARIWRWQS
jgi:outer membrane cobalamin receptor